MIRTLTIFALLLSGIAAGAQDFSSALHLNDQRYYRGARPRQITLTSTYFEKDGKEVRKTVLNFDASGMLLLMENFNASGALSQRSTYSNDTARRLVLNRTTEVFTAYGSYTETAFFEYDSLGCLRAMEFKDGYGKLVQKAKIVCNDRRQPVEISYIDLQGRVYRSEKGKYDYDSNKVYLTVTGNTGKTMPSDTITIRYNADPEDFPNLNSHGDLLSWRVRQLNGSYIGYEAEYKYDRQGNCTLQTRYELVPKSNGGYRRKLDAIFDRRYVY